MTVYELSCQLDLLDPEAEIGVTVNEVVHVINRITEDSQGAYLEVDYLAEERRRW